MSLPVKKIYREFRRFIEDPSDSGVNVRTWVRNAYNSVSDYFRVVELNPLNEQNISFVQVSITNETNATVPRYIDVKNYSVVKIHFVKVGGTDTVTLTVEGSCQDDGTALSILTYEDITQYGCTPLTTGTAASSYTSDVVLEVLVKGLSALKVQTVSSGGANDGDYKLYVRGAY